MVGGRRDGGTEMPRDRHPARWPVRHPVEGRCSGSERRRLHTLRMIRLRWSTQRIANQNRTNETANPRDASSAGPIQEA